MTNLANCSACGAKIAPGVRFCASCGRPITAFAIPKKKTSDPTKFLAVFLAVSALVYVFARMTGSYVPAPEPTVVRDPCKDKSFNYLLALKEGKSLIASAYWKPGKTPKTLFAVQNFDYISHGEYVQVNGSPHKIPQMYYKYEVESSTKGGFPIRKRWGVIMEPSTKDVTGDPCPIIELAEIE